MPLQKSPPSVAPPSTSKPSLTRAQLAERRRTLQTVCELSSLKTTPAEFPPCLPTGASSSVHNGYDAREVGIGTKTSRSHKRRSLPTNGFRQGRVQSVGALQSSETLTARRSSADLRDWRGESTRRYSHDARFPNIHSSGLDPLLYNQSSRAMSPQTERIHDDRRGNQDEMSRLSWNNLHSNVSRGKQATRNLNTTGKPLVYGGGWNAHRERERMKSERGMIEAREGREREKRGLAIGSSSTLPSISPLPMARPKEVQIRGPGTQKILLQNSRSLHGTPRAADKKPISPQVDSQWAYGDVHAELLKPASTNNYNDLVQTAYQDPIQRARSCSSTASHARNTLPQLASTLPLPSFPSQTPSDPSPSAARPSFSSIRPSPNPTTRTSSTRSNGSGNTSTTQVSRSSAGSKYQGHPSGAAREPWDELTTRSTLTPSSRRPPGDGQVDRTAPSLPKLEFEHNGSNVETRVGRLPVAPPTPEQLSQARYRSRSRSRSRAASNRVSLPAGHTASNASSRGREDKATSQDGFSADQVPKSVLIQREKEKLERWKAEKVRREFQRQQRAKISERVRRANELEEEREKELVREGKGTTKAKGKAKGRGEEKKKKKKGKGKDKEKTGRGCLGGLFGMFSRARSTV